MWFILSIIGSLFYWLLFVPRWMEVSGLYIPVIYGLSLVTATIGYKIGAAIRNFVMPDRIWVVGGFTDLLETKIWWMIGPQGAGFSGGAVVPYAALMGLIDAGILPRVL